MSLISELLSSVLVAVALVQLRRNRIGGRSGEPMGRSPRAVRSNHLLPNRSGRWILTPHRPFNASRRRRAGRRRA